MKVDEILGTVELFPNIHDAPAGAMVARLDNGARAVVVVGDDGGATVVSFLHGPYIEVELDRLGLAGAKLIRVRERPDDFWSTGPTPPELAAIPMQIPAELRGRVGTVMGVGGGYKYDVTAQVRLHRVRPGEPRETLALPLIWLERHEG